MNCQRCNTTIDYRFLTNCEHCEIEQANFPTVDPNPQLQPLNAVEDRVRWPILIINLVYILFSSMAGLISGAVVIFFGTGIIGPLLISSTGNPSADCVRGNAIGILALVSGAFLGTVAGSVFAVKKPLCKGE